MKKFLSIILAVVMLVAMVPATFASAAEPAVTDLNYILSHAAHFSSKEHGPNTPGYVSGGTDIRISTAFSEVSIEDTDTSVSSGRWGNLGYRDGGGEYGDSSAGFGASCGIHRSGDFWNYVYDKATVNSTDGFYNWDSRLKAGTNAPIAMLTIEVPVSGTYIPALNGTPINGQLHELFLVKVTDENKTMDAWEIRENLKPSERLGAYDASISGEQKFMEHYLEKGIYYLCFTPNGRGKNTAETLADKAQTGMYMKSFHLYAPEEKEEVVVESYDPSKLGEDGKLTYTFKSSSFNIANWAPKLNADGQPIDAEGNVAASEEDYVYDWYYGDSDAALRAYAKYQGLTSTTDKNSPFYEVNGALKYPALTANTWTDQSEAAKAAGKYIPWSFTDANGVGAWSRVLESIWRIYPANDKKGGKYLIGTYDYINKAKSDPWQYVSYGSAIATGQIYLRGTTGIHYQVTSANLQALGSGSAYQVFKIQIPTAAKYQVSATLSQYTKKTGIAAYILPAKGKAPTAYADRAPYKVLDGTWNATSVTGTTFSALTAGDYYLIVEMYRAADTVSVEGTYDADLAAITLTALGEPEVPVEEVDPELAAKRAAMVLDEGNPSKEAVSSTNATVNVLARAVGTDEEDADIADVITTETVLAGAAYTTPEAPEIEGYKFLYWGVGIGKNMRPVSTEATATIKAGKGANYIAAFYSKNDDTDAIVEFYNANGNLVKRDRYEDGEEIEIPALPTLTGVGTAIGWTDDGGETVIGTEEVIEADGPIMAFFAVYDDEAIAKNIEITVSGSTGIKGARTYAFGEEVSLVAPTRENETGYNMFLYWKKNGEIVSFDREYKFNAAVSCNVEAVYAKYGPSSVEKLRKILVSVAGEAVVAEFLGCENALERGFVFGEYRQPMKTDAKSFTMINDTTSEARAYAIFADGVIFSK